ncbi:phosphoribosylglycinamide formyltransferase [Anaeromicrobium sediminis]|uniref:Phosphoribosylglycinamide formyltransferase n=1 Tax=Anaeromicrobium sediminis TaxID=1478221 RepID=A0A267MKF7_9FIRM|nr:phosphoribosylglycinamide formyltransferase [Anaeromicrobium sediminis]PAB59270.1 phosphoribosylglycinamide formyltransferase [Anaeromicrobium sediminis]
MLNIAVFISGSGSNLQAIIDNVHEKNIDGEIKLILSDNKNAKGIERGKKHNIKTHVIEKAMGREHNTDEIVRILEDCKIDLIVLAGFLSILDEKITRLYPKKIINIHPSLIPKYCGRGFYGQKVHKAVIENKEKITGATVHFVDEGVDTGPIIKQKTCDVYEYDTVETVQKRVLEIEHEILVDVIKEFCR